MIRAGFDLLAGMAWNRGTAAPVVNNPMLGALLDSTALGFQPPLQLVGRHIHDVIRSDNRKDSRRRRDRWGPR